MDVAAVARCAGRCYVSPAAFGESRNLRLSLSNFRSLEPAGLMFRGKSQRTLSISARQGMIDPSVNILRAFFYLVMSKCVESCLCFSITQCK